MNERQVALAQPSSILARSRQEAGAGETQASPLGQPRVLFRERHVVVVSPPFASERVENRRLVREKAEPQRLCQDAPRVSGWTPDMARCKQSADAALHTRDGLTCPGTSPASSKNPQPNALMAPRLRSVSDQLMGLTAISSANSAAGVALPTHRPEMSKV